MKKLAKLLLPSISIMLVAIMALTGATYAWFETGNSAILQDDIQADVMAADGLLVSWDAEIWKSSLKFDVSYVNAGNTNFTVDTFEYAPVSTAPTATYDPTTGALKMYNASTKNGKIIGVSEATGGFVKFDIYINLTENSEVWVYDLEVNEAKKDQETIAQATRVAFIYQGTNAGYNLDAIKALKADALTDSENLFVYEPYAAKHTENGKNQQTEYIKTTATSEGYYPYMGLKAEYTMPEGSDGLGFAEDGAYMSAVTTVKEVSGTTGDLDNPTVGNVKFDMPKGYSKLTVYVWVEGQDADCLNDLSGQALTVNFSLAKKTKAAE